MNIVMGAASAAMITLAVVSPPTTGTGDCQSAGEAFQAVVAKVTNALRAYEQCVSASKGQDKCSAEMQQLDDAHDDFEDAVLGWGSALEGQGKFQDAHKIYADFISAHPKFSNTAPSGSRCLWN